MPRPIQGRHPGTGRGPGGEAAPSGPDVSSGCSNAVLLFVGREGDVAAALEAGADDFHVTSSGLAGLPMRLRVAERVATKRSLATAHRAANLTRQMLAYSGKGRVEVRPIELSAHVREIASLLETTVPKKVQLRLELSSDLPAFEMNGEETFREIRRMRADTPVILTSGYSELEATRRFTSKGLAGFLEKPFTPADLAGKLAKVIVEHGLSACPGPPGCGAPGAD
jgi:DNA-binding response OmpR family regulator